ncbi:uncharacterized protein [Nicotiana sylvestris]|uniref:uncharacterized protein n=1 Tax=Nicotiana sylvestris TaxID=4096 RepID=UPI00388C709F
MGTVVDEVNSSSTSNGFVPFSLDSSHPFYIHPSDNPRSQLVSVPFNGCGFVLWRNSMLTSFSAKNKLSLLDGRVNQPTPESPYYPYWERCNDMVKAWITNLVSREIAVSVMCFRTAKEVWKDINERFCQSNGSKYIQIQREISSTTQGSSDIASYVTKMRSLWDELNSSYAYSLLQQDESQREAHFAAPNFSSDATSFLVSPSASTTNRPFSQKVNFEAKKAAPNVSCKYCKKPGHTVDKCYRLHGFPTDFKFTKSKKYASCVQTKSPSTTAVTTTSQHADSSAHGFTKEQYQHLLTLFQQVQMSNISTPDASNVDQSTFAHFACLFSKYVVDSEVSHVCTSSQLGVNPWILDARATNHMTPHKHLLFNVQPLIKPFLVTLPNGYKAKVVSTGSLYLRHDIILLHGPSLKRPLEIGKAAGRLYYLHPDGDLFPVPSDSLNVSSSSLPSSVSTSSDLPSSISLSDNAFELGGSSEAAKFFSSQGILHQTSIPHTPQQNGGISPYEKLHGLPPLYDHLKSFVCLCFATSPKFGREKFQARAIHSIFFGYPFGKKGYKLLNLTTHSIFFSRDVVFHENIFPYKSDHPSIFPTSSISDFVDSSSSSTPSPTPDVSTSPDSPVPSPLSPPPITDSSHIIPSPPLLRKSTRTVHQHSYLKDYVCSSVSSSHPLPSSSKVSDNKRNLGDLAIVYAST